jgi:endonuclease/exonuclease/phosphatase (EEP) superfamily protein YafD
MMRPFFTGLHWATFGALGFVGAVIVGVTGASMHWTFDLLGQFLLPAFVLALLIVPVAALARWRWIAGAAALFALVTYALAMPTTSPPKPVNAEAVRFKVLLFNVWYGNKRLGEVAQTIARENPDLVVIIEGPKRVRKALKAVADTYPYRFECSSADCDGFLFSRGRLLPQQINRTRDPEHSPYMMIGTEIAGCRMTLVVTHMTRPFPNAPYWAQRAQAEEIGSAIGAIRGAKLVLGDFNAAPWGYVMHTIETRGGVKLLTGAGGTWPTALPSSLRIPIDHMLAGPGLSFVSRKLMPPLGSDHAAVVAEVAVTDPTQCR